MREFTQTKKLMVVFFAIIALGINAEAQVTEHYYGDTEKKEGGDMSVHLQYNNTIIIGAVSPETYRVLPVVMRIDTLGNVLWNTGITDTTVYSYDRCRVDRLMFSGGFIFATVYLENYYSTSQMEFWKIDPASGQIIWKKHYQVYSGNKMLPLLDYDSTYLLTGYKNNSGSNNYLVFVNKQNGDTLNNFKIETGGWEFKDIAIDSYKDIYYLLGDILYKRSGTNPQNLLWQNTYSGTEDLKRVYVDANDSVFIFGNSAYPYDYYSRVYNINRNNGASLWMTQHYITNSSMYRDMKDKSGFLYITWQHKYVGGISSSFQTNKINKLTGQEEWFNDYGFIIPGVGPGGQQSAISLDLDQSGNVYLTGYCNSANYEPATFAILKLNGSNGNALYQKVIDLDTNIVNELSLGLASCVINNKPYFAGNLQIDFVVPRQRIVFIKLNPVTGDTIFMKFSGGNYQYPSKTIYIGDYINQQTLVLKQAGRSVKLEKYDFAKHLVWERTFTSEYYLAAGHIASSPSGDIYISALSSAYYDLPPFYAASKDSLFIFQLNNSGNLVYSFSEYVNSININLLEMHADNAGALIAYNKGGYLFYRKISSQIMSAEQSDYFINNSTLSPSKNIVNASPSEAWIFGTVSPLSYFTKLDKNTMTTIIPADMTIRLYRINWAGYYDASHALVCGKNSNNRECIGMYNTSAYDTTWTRQLSLNTGSEALKCITNPAKNYIYVMSHNASNIEIQKLSAANGAQKWVYTYNGSANLDDVPQNIAYDNLRNQLLVTGYEKNGLYKQVLILTLDSTGAAIDTIKRIGDFKGDNMAVCPHVLYNGTQWVGGNLNKNPYGKAGFIYETAVLPCTTTSSSQTVSACCPLLWMGHTYTASGIYSDTIPNNAGCDSVLFLNLNYFEIVASVTQNDSLLTADTGTYSYQWVNCDSAFAPINGATNQTFIAQSNGNYAVILNQGPCSDTSLCIYVNSIGISELTDNGYSIFPNPSNHFIIIKTPSEIENRMFTIYDITGKIILQNSLQDAQTHIDISHLSKGLYFIKLNTTGGSVVRKFDKE